MRIQIASIGMDYEGKLNAATNEITGTFKQLGMKAPLNLKLTTEPTAVTTLSEADYAPRKDSDLQGLWQASLKVAKDVSLRLNLKIAEQADGTFNAQMDSVDQGASGLTVSSLTYQHPTMNMELQSVGGTFKGDVNSSDTKITGTWKQGNKSYPLVFSRADASAAEPLAGDYTYNGPNDIPGHWHGTLDVKQMKLRLAFDLSRMADGTYACNLVSLDQGGSQVPATSVAFTAPKLRMEWKAMGAIYTADLKDGKLAGKWTQGKMPFPLDLERTAAR